MIPVHDGRITQQERIIKMLSDGEWHGMEEIRERIASPRKRMSELCSLHPGRFQSRMRTRYEGTPNAYRMKDWIDATAHEGRLL